MKKKRNLLYWAIALVLLPMPACKKFVEVTPATGVDASVIFSGDEPAGIALTGLYAKMVQHFGLVNGYLSRYGSLYADDLAPLLPQGSDLTFFKAELNPAEKVVGEIWSAAYNHINQANQVIENIAQSAGMTETGRRQLTAEAKFLRALLYFYLVNLFGDVPLVLSTRYQETQHIRRTPVREVYRQVVQDLQEAEQALPVSYPAYPATGTVPIRATRYAAMALLARVYLYLEDWQQAEQQSTKLIETGRFALAAHPNDAFRMNSPELILAFQPTNTTYNTAEGNYFVYLPTMPMPYYVLTDSLVAAFEPQDSRFTSWAKPAIANGKKIYAPDKYEIQSSEQLVEVSIVLRLTEPYLIRAEANTQLGNIPAALADINTIRQRAGLPGLSADGTKDQAMRAIEQERRIEFFAEWGHRWFDLRRWPSLLHPAGAGKTRADDVLGKAKAGAWAGFRKYWPIPANEITKLPALSQNEGYE